MSRPIVIEFSGLPNSGKTTLLHNLKNLCDKNAVSAIFVPEPAERFPKDIISKGSIAQNIWIKLEEIQTLIEVSSIAQKSKKDFIFLDRGFYNSVFWINLFKEQYPEISSYFMNLIDSIDTSFHLKPDFLYVIDVSVEESLRRRRKQGGPITFSKEDFLSNYRINFKKFYQSLDAEVLYQDTTNLSKDAVAKLVFKQITSLL